MSVRQIAITDEQINLIAEGLRLLIKTKLHILIEDGDEVKLQEAELLLGCAEATVKEPEDRDMLHGWAL